MGDLRDQLKKAKLISEKEARRLAHEERVKRSEIGQQGLEQQQRERAAELQRLRDEERAQTRTAQAELERQRREEAEHAAVLDILAREATKPSGGSRFHFETPGGALPCIEITEGERRNLLAGQVCIVRTGPIGTHVYGLLPTPLARRVGQLFPEVVVFAPRGVVRA